MKSSSPSPTRHWLGHRPADVAVSVGNAVPARVERVDLASGKRTLVREIAPSDSAGMTSVRVTQWIDDGRGYVYVYDFLRRDDALFVVK